MDKRIAELSRRLTELEDADLESFETEILVPSLAAAADAQDVGQARELSRMLEAARAEKKHRRIEREENQRELDGLLQAAGLAEKEQPDPTPEPLTVAALKQGMPRLSDLAKRKRSPIRSRVPVEPSRWSTEAGVELNSTADVAASLMSRFRTFGTGRATIATARWELGADRHLTQDPAENRAKLEAIMSPQALVASGGICAPVTPSYDFPGGSTGMRPLRDGLPRFDADRGGIVFLPSPRLIDVDAGVGITTEAEDVSGENYPKPCLVVACSDPTELRVQAVHRCLQFSNFNARTHPEAVNEYIDLTIAAAARAAEDSLWDMMVTASVAVTADENLSATRDVLAAVGRAAAQIRSRHRLNPEAILRWAAPAWLADMLSADMSRQAPGDMTMAITRADIEGWLRARNVRPIWSLDAGGQAFSGGQGAGPLLGWPDDVETLLFPEGTFVHVDSGELDLGMVRDSSLNLTNDVQLFAEVFETVAMVGVESYALTLNVCASGASAAPIENAIDCLAAS